MATAATWSRFFLEAGIPAAAAAQYAVSFVENRISMDMLMELNKEYLRDLGVIVLGDIIAILRHAKAAQGKITMQKVTAATGTSQDSSLAKKVTSTASAASSKERASVKPPRPAEATVPLARRPPVLPETEATRKGPPTVQADRLVADLKTGSAKLKSAASSRLGPPPSEHDDRGGNVFNRLGVHQNVEEEEDELDNREDEVHYMETRRVHMTGVKPSLKTIQMKQGSGENSATKSAFERLGGKEIKPVQRSEQGDAAAGVDASRLKRFSGTYEGNPAVRPPGRPSSENEDLEKRRVNIKRISFDEDSQKLPASEGKKKKFYVLVRHRADGTSTKERISEDDPILKQVPIIKKRVPAKRAPDVGSASTSGPVKLRQKGVVNKTAALKVENSHLSSLPTSSRTRISPPREPRKRQRITGPGKSPISKSESLSPRPKARTRISPPRSDSLATRSTSGGSSGWGRSSLTRQPVYARLGSRNGSY